MQNNFDQPFLFDVFTAELGIFYNMHHSSYE